MKTQNYSFDIQLPFGNLYRDTVVIVVRNSAGKFLLGSKPKFYPPTITRLLGGGVENSESPVLAAQRKLIEELGVELNIDQFELDTTIQISAVDMNGKEYNPKIHIVKVICPIDKYTPSDDVEAIDVFSVSEMQNLVNSYQNLSETLWYKGEEGEYSWKDYGQIYSIIHQKAIESVSV